MLFLNLYFIYYLALTYTRIIHTSAPVSLESALYVATRLIVVSVLAIAFTIMFASIFWLSFFWACLHFPNVQYLNRQLELVGLAHEVAVQHQAPAHHCERVVRPPARLTYEMDGNR